VPYVRVVVPVGKDLYVRDGVGEQVVRPEDGGGRPVVDQVWQG